MKIIIELPDTSITENIIKNADWEEGSLFDMVLREAIKNCVIISNNKNDKED